MPVANRHSQAIPYADLHNSRGDSARILALGGILNEFRIATREQGDINIILGYPHVSSYCKDTAFHGALIGRYCNRIAGSQFAIEGITYQLPNNEGEHHLHGGPEGFHRRLWKIVEHSRHKVVLSLHSPHLEQGYPGNVDIRLCYTLTDDGTLQIEWQAESDRDTVVGLTSHAYFNLAGHGDILDHYLRIPAPEFTPVDDDQIPTGAIESVVNSPLDLREFTPVARPVNADDPRIAAHGGLDHNWARGAAGQMQLSAELLCPDTQLLLQCSSTLPGLQCYTGNHLQGGGVHGCHEGLCLEPQYYPDSPNQPNFPSPILRAGATMRHRISYQVSEVDISAVLKRP